MLLLLSLAFYVFRDVTFSYKHLTKSFFRAKVPDPRRQTRGESLVFRSMYLDASYFPAVLRAFLARSPVALTLVNSSRWVLRSEVNNSLIIVNFFHKIQNFRQISDLFSQI